MTNMRKIISEKSRWSYHIARYSGFLLPVFLTHGRAVAEILFVLISLCFLVHCTTNHRWEWLQEFWVRCALLWWAWMMICSAPLPWQPERGQHDTLFQAFATARFLVGIMALRFWILVDKRNYFVIMTLIVIAGTYIGLNILAQGITGYNFYGVPLITSSGVSTGPYMKPIASAPESRLLLPLIMLSCSWLVRYFSPSLKKYTLVSFFGCLVIVMTACSIMVLSGQRMPFVLFIFGLYISALCWSPLRITAVIITIILPLLVFLSSIISPYTYHHLVIMFYEQLSNFCSTPYAIIFNRALNIGVSHPWMGLGFDAFRYSCPSLTLSHTLPFLVGCVGSVTGTSVCTTHTHNQLLEALDNGGILGLILFVALVAAWLTKLIRGIYRMNRVATLSFVMHAWLIGLFAAIVVHFWPLTSSSNMFNMPLGGWSFLMLGMALTLVDQGIPSIPMVKKENLN